MRPIRVVPPLYFLATVTTMLVVHKLAPLCQLIPSPWKWLGMIPIAAGLLLSGWAASLFIRRGTTLRPGQPSSHLVTGGPCNYTRNPMYLGLTSILLGLAVRLGSFSPWLLIPVFVWLIERNVIPVEEAMLAAAFGEAYRQYRVRVRRWI